MTQAVAWWEEAAFSKGWTAAVQSGVQMVQQANAPESHLRPPAVALASQKAEAYQTATASVPYESPVTIEKGRVKVKDDLMEVGKLYVVAYGKRQLALSKTPSGKVRVYELPR